jgi:acyl carrier protein
MEVCIAIEVALGISLAPEELQRYASLGELANDLRERLSG